MGFFNKHLCKLCSSYNQTSVFSLEGIYYPMKALIRKKRYFTKVCSFWADNCTDYVRQLFYYQENWCRLSAVIAMITYSMKYSSTVFGDIRKTASVRGLELKDISINPCVVSQTNISKRKGCPKDIFKKFYSSNDLKGFFKKKHF